MDLATIIVGTLAALANGLAAVIWTMIVKNRNSIECLTKDMALVKYNYLDRFDDLKECIKGFELKVIERITILETLINKKG